MTVNSHNAADDYMLTRGPAKVWNALARPLSEYIYAPLEKKNHTLGVIATNATLTAPGLLEIPLTQRFSHNIKRGNLRRAKAQLIGKAIIKSSDGLDGAAARQSGTTSQFGAIFDPIINVIGSATDVYALRQIDGNRRPKFVKKVVSAGVVLEAATALVAVGLNGAAQKYAEHNGVELEAAEEAKANGPGKAKYFAKAAGNVALEAELACESRVAQEIYNVTGIGLNLASIGLGIQGAFEYVGSAISKIRKVQAIQAGQNVT